MASEGTGAFGADSADFNSSRIHEARMEFQGRVVIVARLYLTTPTGRAINVEGMLDTPVQTAFPQSIPPTVAGGRRLWRSHTFKCRFTHS